MKRRTLDIVFSAGGVLFAVLLLVLGLVLQNQANFAKDYVRDQLAAQQIFFSPVENLSAEEAQVPCLVENAGQQLTTGKQAECYANEYIGRHVAGTADGLTYAQLGAPQRELRAQITEARETNDPALPELEAQLAEVNQQRETVFKGETLRGVLLTSYGFSIFGERAGQAAAVAFAAAALLFLLSVAGFIHAFLTPRDRRVLVTEPAPKDTVDA
jgi:hypothetical protein